MENPIHWVYVLCPQQLLASSALLITVSHPLSLKTCRGSQLLLHACVLIYIHTYTPADILHTKCLSKVCRKERWRRWKKILFLHVLTFRRRSSSGFVFVTLLSQITKSSSGDVQPLMCRNVFRGCLFDTEVMVYFISSCSKAAEKITWKPNWKLSPHFFFPSLFLSCLSSFTSTLLAHGFRTLPS